MKKIILLFIIITSVTFGLTKPSTVDSTTTGEADKVIKTTSNANIMLNGATEEGWSSGLSVIQYGGNGSIAGDITAGSGKYFYSMQNAYFNGGVWNRQSDDEATRIQQNNGEITMSNAVFGVADSSISWQDVFIIKADGYPYMPRTQTGTGTNLVISNTDGQILRDSSSERYKQNIREISLDPKIIYNILVKEYEYNDTGQYNISPTAEQMFEVSPYLVFYDNEGRPDALASTRVMWLMLLEIQRLNQRVLTLEGGTP